MLSFARCHVLIAYFPSVNYIDVIVHLLFLILLKLMNLMSTCVVHENYFFIQRKVLADV